MNKTKKRIVSFSLIIIGIILIGIGYVYENNKSTLKVNNKNLLLEGESYQKEYSKYYSSIEKAIIYSDKYLIDSYPIEDFGKINSKDKTIFLLNMMSAKLGTKLTKDNLEKEKKNYFKEDTKLSYEILKKNSKILYNYDEKNKQFTIGNGYKPKDYIIQTKELSTKIYSDKWVTKKKVYYIEMTSTEQMYPQKVYKNIEDATKKQNEIFTITDVSHPFNEEEYKKVENQLESFTYTLKKEKSKYLLSSIEINKNASSKN